MVFNVPQSQQVGYEAGPSIYNFYTGRLENPKVQPGALWRCSYKGSTFFPVFKDPECSRQRLEMVVLR